MRIDGASRGAPATRSRPAAGRTGNAGGWTAPAVGPGAGGPLAATRLAPLAGLDALLALQQVEDAAAERRRRAARRGAALLDGLAELHQGLLAGVLPERTLQALRRGLGELERMPEDPALQAVLVEIAVRVEVELAKLEVAGAGVPSEFDR